MAAVLLARATDHVPRSCCVGVLPPSCYLARETDHSGTVPESFWTPMWLMAGGWIALSRGRRTRCPFGAECGTIVMSAGDANGGVGGWFLDGSATGLCLSGPLCPVSYCSRRSNASIAQYSPASDAVVSDRLISCSFAYLQNFLRAQCCTLKRS